MTDDQAIENAYLRMQEVSIELAEGSSISILAIAGVMIAQALTIYRTAFSPEEYEKICETIYESRDQVKKVTIPRTVLQ